MSRPLAAAAVIATVSPGARRIARTESPQVRRLLCGRLLFDAATPRMFADAVIDLLDG